jgi:glyoxylase-like metal-dependent hydrolase (beta-lactamase superfamily II)
MLATIAELTPLAVELVVISHPIQEFVFGAAAFQEQGIPILAHAETAELMRRRCEVCLNNLRRSLGEEEMRGSRVVTPDRLVKRSTRLTMAGRDLELLYFRAASTPGDLAILDRTSGVLFAGGLVSVGRIPELRDADLRGWIDALQQLDKLPIKAVVPAHGPVIGRKQMRQTADYLRALEAKVSALYRDGTGLTDTIAQAQLPAFASWSLYAVIHPQNVQHVYLQLENEDFK